MNDLADLLTIAQQAVGLGYDLVRNTTPQEIRHKGDRDIVTDVDVRIEEEVREFLGKMTPGIGFLGEEQGGPSVLAADQDVWTLDPVDGTSNFAHGIPLCAISLALIRQGEPVVAAIVAPQLGLRYHAAKGQGAYGINGRLQVSNTTDLSQAIVSIGDYAVGPNAAEKNKIRLRLTALLAERVERIRMFGTAALDLAWVAEGRTDATIILANKPWDTAAGVLVAREAGAEVVNDSGAQHDLSSTETIAVTPELAALVVKLVGATK
ncbi:MAG TPA: inositol monophosphatase family protein [Actinophytocola sp.]|uniref:inositol monophosphatase family protein n=1 Tax=Actinophytocola sp. TaxID=1872138 RepID=UPI002DBC52F2|nr:inositol monophosphatase family protein [Actinophytocola sp.]HEU5476131.1 inositol monophosphatase family protein [Actinophytocola sp.]